MLRRAAHWLFTNRVTRPLITLALTVFGLMLMGDLIRWLYSTFGPIFIVPWLIACLVLAFVLDG